MEDDTSSLLCLGDAQSRLSQNTDFSEASGALDVSFKFDSEIMASRIYMVAHRSYLRHVVVTRKAKPDMRKPYPSPRTSIQSLAVVPKTQRAIIVAKEPTKLIDQGQDADELITPDTAEEVLLLILKSLDNVYDLFSLARVSKGFYRTFKRNEATLLKQLNHEKTGWGFNTMIPIELTNALPTESKEGAEKVLETIRNYYKLYPSDGFKDLFNTTDPSNRGLARVLNAFRLNARPSRTKEVDELPQREYVVTAQNREANQDDAWDSSILSSEPRSQRYVRPTAEPIREISTQNRRDSVPKPSPLSIVSSSPTTRTKFTRTAQKLELRDRTISVKKFNKPIDRSKISRPVELISATNLSTYDRFENQVTNPVSPISAASTLLSEFPKGSELATIGIAQ